MLEIKTRDMGIAVTYSLSYRTKFRKVFFQYHVEKSAANAELRKKRVCACIRVS